MRSLILFALVLAAANLHADLPLTAHWDFTKGSINSVDGKYQMSFRGASEIVTVNGEKALLPGMTTGPKPSGIMCSGNFKGLSPVGAFRIETEVSFNEPTSNRPQMFLYDTKNVPYVSKAPLDNIGILFYVARDFKRKDFVLGLSCGAGSQSFNVPRASSGKNICLPWNMIRRARSLFPSTETRRRSRRLSAGRWWRESAVP